MRAVKEAALRETFLPIGGWPSPCFGLAIAIAVTAGTEIGNVWRTTVWVVSLGTMGGACHVNVLRWRRVHCYLSGPFFLVLAVVTLLYGLGILSLPENGGSLLGLTLLAGTIALCCLPEIVWGRYRQARAKDGDHC